MGYDRGDSFPFDIEPTGIPFGSESKEKLSPRSYPIQCERKWKYSFLSDIPAELPCFYLHAPDFIPANHAIMEINEQFENKSLRSLCASGTAYLYFRNLYTRRINSAMFTFR